MEAQFEDKAKQTLSILKLLKIRVGIVDDMICFYSTIKHDPVLSFTKDSFKFYGNATGQAILLEATSEMLKDFDLYYNYIKIQV